MNYPCNLIQDLLPLYQDGVCSEESAEIIENHLSECTDCKAYLAALCEADQIATKPQNTAREMEKVASFQAIKRKLRRKQAVTVTVAFVLLFTVAFAITGILKKSVAIIPCTDNISVSMIDDSLIGRLRGNQANDCNLKRVDITIDGQMQTYLFFCLSGSKWEAITTSDKVFSEYLLCSPDKGSEQIDRVYYYTGAYADIESMSEADLQKVIDTSVLLWHK